MQRKIMKRYVMPLFLSLSFSSLLTASQPNKEIDVPALINQFKATTCEYQKMHNWLENAKKNNSQDITHDDLEKIEHGKKIVERIFNDAMKFSSILNAALYIENMQKISQDENMNNQKNHTSNN